MIHVTPAIERLVAEQEPLPPRVMAPKSKPNKMTRLNAAQAVSRRRRGIVNTTVLFSAAAAERIRHLLATGEWRSRNEIVNTALEALRPPTVGQRAAVTELRYWWPAIEDDAHAIEVALRWAAQESRRGQITRLELID